MADYLYILVTLIIGMSITDMVVSTHRLLIARDRVRWHWLPAVLAVIMLLQLLGFWWLWYGMYDGWPSISVAQFLPDLVILTLLFLACATVLPNDVPKEGVDLKAYYFDTSRLFWILFGLYVTVASLVLPLRFAGNAPLGTMILYNLPNVGLIVLAILLSRTRKPKVHAVALALLLPYTIVAQTQLIIRADSATAASPH